MQDIEGKLQQAVDLHRSGQVRQAVAGYQEILTLHPNHPGALHYLGLAHFGAGQLDQAERLMSRSLELDAEQPKAWANLANIHLARKQTDDAQQALRKAVALDPNLVNGWLGLGDLLVQTGESQEAEACYRRAMELAPNDVDLLCNLGSLIMLQGNHAEAVDLFQRAINGGVANPAILNNLGFARFSLGETDAALAAFDKALAADPSFAEAHANKAKALQASGRMDEAADAFRQALSHQPALGECYRHLAGLGRLDEADIARMEEMLAGKDGLSAAAETHLRFALARGLEDRDETARSFVHLLKGNAARRRGYMYAARDYRDFVEQMKTSFATPLRAQPTPQGNALTPIFILGMPRSGTTLVEQILGAHSSVAALGERDDITDFYRRTVAGANGHASFKLADGERLAQLDSPGLAQAYWAATGSIEPGITHVTDKMPTNFNYIGLILALFPDACILHCRRHPMATCYSNFKQLFAGRHEWAYDLQELGHYYNGYQQLMDHWEALYPGRVHPVHYEKLVQQPEDEIRRLVDLIGLAWEESCLAFHQSRRQVRTASLAQVRQPVYRKALSEWQKVANELSPLREVLAGQIARYEEELQ